jgi:hypothetical protein
MGLPTINHVEQIILKMPIYRKRKALRMAKKQPSTFIMRQSSSSITQNLGWDPRNDSLVSHALEVLGWYYDET